MSERELNRIEVLSQVTQGRMTAVTAANVLGLSRRQVHRLLKDFQTDGPAAIRHKARGRRSNNRIDPAVSEFAVTLVRETYIDFGPTFAAEKLAEDHGLKVSRETLRNALSCILQMHCRVIDAGRRNLVEPQTAPHVPSASFASGMLRRTSQR
jgi:response regulator of citrate/malate metabolism